MRGNRNIKTIINDLSKTGMTKKAIADKIGIPTRTFYSYSRYFEANRPNKHSRTPPKNVIKSIKKLAQSKKIRTTYNLSDNPAKFKRLFISCIYLYIDDNGNSEKRHLLIEVPDQLFYFINDKHKYLENRIKQVYRNNSTKFQGIILIDFRVKTENEFFDML